MPSILKMSYSIYTHLSLHEVQRVLEKNVGSHWDFSGKEPFTGVVEEDTFRISTRSKYRNSFKPVLYGSIQASGRGSVIHVNARLHPFTMIFSIIWLVLACRFLAVGISLAVQGGSLFPICISAVFLVAYLFLGGISYRQGYQSAQARLNVLLATKNRP